MTRELVEQRPSSQAACPGVSDQPLDAGPKPTETGPDHFGVARVLARVQRRDVRVGEGAARNAPLVGIAAHPLPAAGDAIKLAVEVDVPGPIEARFGEGGVEGGAMAFLRLGQGSVDVENERFDHGSA